MSRHSGFVPSADPHVSDRWCVKQSGPSPEYRESSAVSRPPPLLLWTGLQDPSGLWKRSLRALNPCNSQVSELRDFLVGLQPWEPQAFCCDWTLIPDSHEFVGLIGELQPNIEDVGNFHIFLDGSYLPETQVGAWAFTVLLRSSTGEYYRWGFSGGILDACNGSLHAEAVAFAFVLDWIVTSLADTMRSIYVYGDATAVGLGADGAQNIATGLDDLGVTVRYLFCLAQSLLPSLAYLHVKAHCGQIDNECVDSLARAIAKQSWSPHSGTPDLCRWFEVPLLPWAWLLIENCRVPASSLPDLDDLVAGKSLPSVPQGPAGVFGTEPECTSIAKPIQTSLKLGTANVRSLKEKLKAPFSDKAELICHQMIAQHFDLFAIQESRAYCDRVSSLCGVTRFIAAANGGHGGVELWINPEGPLSLAGCGPLGAHHFCVRSSSSTWLVLDCDHPLLQCIIAVVYAPQSGRATADIDAWRSLFEQELKPFLTKDLVLLGDFNAHVGSVEVDGIGSLGWAEENVAGSHLRCLIEQHDMVLPSTFGLYHSGPSPTFRSASGGCLRVDYVGIPNSWLAGVKASYVDQDFDLMSGDFDHHVVVLELEMSIRPSSGSVRSRRAQYDRQAARANPSLLKKMLDSIPSVPWGVATDQHWAVIERHCSGFLKKHFPLPKRHVRQAYFSQQTWSILQARKDLSIQIREADRKVNCWRLARVFALWRSCVSQGSSGAVPPACDVACAFQDRALLLWARNQLDSRFRAQRKADLASFRATCSLRFNEAMCGGDVSSLYKALRPKRPVNREKGFRLPKPLPALCLDDTDEHEHSRRRYLRVWEKHFATVEHSGSIDVGELLDYARAKQKRTIVDTFALQEVPSLVDFERSIRQLSWRKAPGYDGLGAELWQGGVSSNRRGLFALFLKSAFRRYVPLQFRGGFLIPLYKNKGALSDPSNFRGILLQDTSAKIFSKTWRRSLADGLDRYAVPLQLGCRKGLGVNAAHLALRLHVDSCGAKQQSLAILFIDLRSAYYSVVKELYHAGGTGSDEQFLCKLFGKLGLPDAALEDFVAHVSSTCLPNDVGLSSTSAAIVQSTLERSWYQLPSSPDLFAPATGTRPGDPLADILFSYAMSDVLWEVYEVLLRDGSILQLGPDLPAGATWADDTCLFLSGDPQTLERRTAVAFSLVHEACTKRGLRLAYGPFKTAVVMAFRGKGAKPLHKRLFSRDSPSVSCCLEHSGPKDVGAFHTYKHLGSIVDASGSLMPEIKARGNKAYHAIRPLASSCLSCPDIPIDRRRQILQALGLSVLLHNTGSWRKLTKGEMHSWSSFVWKIYCCMLPRAFDAGHPHISLEQAALAAGNFLPAELLHVSRLRLLCQLLRTVDDGLVEAVCRNFEVGGPAA